MAITISGDSPSFASYQGGVLVSGTAVASTSGTNIDFTSIPSWVKRVIVVFSEVSTDSTSGPLLQLGTTSGFETTGYLSTAMQVTTATASSSNSTAGFIVRSILAANVLSGTYTFTLLDATTNSWVGNGQFKGSTVISSFSSGSKVLAGTLTQVRITTVSGTDNFDAGSINILYE
jgi:hypothetical protein